jgi:predicted nucleotidyltransferase
VSEKELKALAGVLADWSAPAPGAILYLHGSRVRGDYRRDSDVDVFIEWVTIGDRDLEWWTANNEEYFASINAKLPGVLQILETNDPLKHKIIAAPIAYEDRSVRCVLLPPKP